jgi:hypothetical protein
MEDFLRLFKFLKTFVDDALSYCHYFVKEEGDLVSLTIVFEGVKASLLQQPTKCRGRRGTGRQKCC